MPHRYGKDGLRGFQTSTQHQENNKNYNSSNHNNRRQTEKQTEGKRQQQKQTDRQTDLQTDLQRQLSLPIASLQNLGPLPLELQPLPFERHRLVLLAVLLPTLTVRAAEASGPCVLRRVFRCSS